LGPPAREAHRSWRGTILEQRRELRLLLESGTLRNHAEAVLPDAYQEAREQAAAETGLDLNQFPADSAWSLDTLIARDPGETPSVEK
jgi:hypothetical protein